MVLREFRFRSEAPVSVRYTRTYCAGDGGLVRRDHARVFVRVDGAVDLLRKQFDRRSRYVRPLANAEISAGLTAIPPKNPIFACS